MSPGSLAVLARCEAECFQGSCFDARLVLLDLGQQSVEVLLRHLDLLTVGEALLPAVEDSYGFGFCQDLLGVNG